MRFNQNQSSVTLLLALFISMGALLACNLSKGRMTGNGMFEGAAMTDAGAALKQKLGGPFKVLDVEIKRDSVRLRVQDPKKPTNVDEYQYRPSFHLLGAPSPVELSSLENNLDNTLFDFDSVNWAATESLARAAIERTQIDGGKIDKMTIERNLAIGNLVTKSGSVNWTVEVSNSREHATAYADAQGNITRLDLSHTSRAAKFNLSSPEALREAVPQINAAFGGRAKLFDLTVLEKDLLFKAQDPKTLEINQYRYDINGVTHDVIADLGGTDPAVRRMLDEHKLEDVLFGLDEFKLEEAPEFGRRALQRLGFENGRISTMTIQRKEISNQSPKLTLIWDVDCQAGRKWGVVMYDLNGKEMGVNTW